MRMSIIKNITKVFVYGTLKKGEPNHHWLTEVKNGVAKLIGSGTSEKKFPLLIATKYNIPFLLNKVGTGHCIKGEIYEVDGQMLLNLDDLEDYPKLYDRIQINVKTDDG